MTYSPHKQEEGILLCWNTDMFNLDSSSWCKLRHKMAQWTKTQGKVGPENPAARLTVELGHLGDGERSSRALDHGWNQAPVQKF